MPQEFTNGNIRVTVIDIVGGDPPVSIEKRLERLELEVQNTGLNALYLGRTANTSADNGYPLAPMSAAGAFDGGRFKTTKFNGTMFFYADINTQVRIVEVGIM